MNTTLRALIAICVIACMIVLVLLDPMTEPDHHHQGNTGFETPPQEAVATAPAEDPPESAVELLSQTPDAERIEVEAHAEVQLGRQEIGFFGTVVSPEVPLEQLWVRLNILSITPEVEQTFDPADFMTWAFDDSILRSKPKRLEPDGSFLLQGRAPSLWLGSLRRYVIEVSMDPPGDAWPLIGKQELLPVAFHWIGDADAETLHGPFSIEAQKPIAIRTHLEMHPQMEWMRPKLMLGVQLQRGEDPPRDSSPQLADRPPILQESRSVWLRITAPQLEVGISLSAVGPPWVARAQLLLESPMMDQPIEAERVPILLTEDVSWKLRVPDLSCVFARIKEPDLGQGGASVSVRWEGKDLAPDPRLRPRELYPGRARSELAVNQQGAFRVPSPLDEDPFSLIQPGHMARDAGGSWCTLGWVPSGRIQAQLIHSQDESIWRSEEAYLAPGAIATIELARTSELELTTLEVPEDVYSASYILLSMLDANGRRISELPGTQDRIQDALKDRTPVKIALPWGAHTLTAYAEVRPGEFLFCTATLPSTFEPHSKVVMRVAPTSFEIPENYLRSGSFLLQSIDSLKPDAAAPRIRTGLGFSDRSVTLRGLPRGSYSLKEQLPYLGGFEGPVDFDKQNEKKKPNQLLFEIK